MKKIVILALTLCMCLPLAACGEDDTFWTQTLSQFELILGSDETPKNEDLFLGAEITYSSNIEDALDPNLFESIFQYEAVREFVELNTYEEMLHLSFNMAVRYYKNFGLITLNTTDGNVKQAHENLRTGIEELSEEVSAFRTAKADFEKALEGIEAKDLYQSEITMQELKEYKRAFSSLILKTSEVNHEFLNTYELSYSQIKTAEDTDISYCYNSSIAQIVYAYNLYAFGEFDGDYTENEEVLSYINILNLAKQNFTNDNFDAWHDIYTRFLVEIDLYKTALNEVDLLNTENLDSEGVAYVNKINNFLNDYVQVLYSATAGLIKGN